MKRIFVLTFLISINVYAFDSEKCKKYLKSERTGLGGGLVSSVSFTSSTGDCAMIGKSENDKKVFLAQNFENMKIDSSRGAGEYIEAYAIVSTCDQKGRNELSRAFQKNFTYIYGDSAEKEPEQVYEAMERVMRTNTILTSGCYHKT